MLNALELTSHDEVRFWCDTGFRAQSETMMARVKAPVRIETICAGKLRRYNSLTAWQHLTQFRAIVWPNIRDGVKLAVGVVQSFCKLLIWRPDVVFCKGGFVCLPVGVVARVLRIPLIIHDSDAHPGLTNRILAKWATKIATGAPLENYNYPAHKAVFVGIPIDEQFTPPSKQAQQTAKAHLGFDSDAPLTLITGGGLGSNDMNMAVVATLEQLLVSTQVLLITGMHNYESVYKATKHLQTPRLQVHGFLSETMIDAMQAADVVVSRAGATALFELSALAKPTILVPNPYLAGGHQIKNAKMYEKAQAAVVVDDGAMNENPEILLRSITELCNNREKQQQLSAAIHRFAKPNAAKDVAKLIRSSKVRAK